MSGTSLDAIDAALVDIERDGDTLILTRLAFAMQPLDSTLRDAVRAVLPPNAGSTRAICELNFRLGEAFAQAATSVAQQAQIPLSDIDLIASHGQTVWHQPDGTPSSLQLGAPAVIAERTGCTVIADFRPRDIAAGGQGAPLVPYFDALFWRHETKHRVLLNIGGIANLTYVPPEGDIIAFDTGPGNVLMDEAMRIITNGEKSFDEDGKLARAGRFEWQPLGAWIHHPYFEKPPPKSTGRELFGPEMARNCIAEAREEGLSDGDILAALADFTVFTILMAFRNFVPRCDEVWVGGGGTRNPVLMDHFQSICGNKLHRTDEIGLPADAKEAVAFAVLGYAALHGYAANVPTATGAAREVVLGSLTPGANYRALLNEVVQSPPDAPRRLLLKPGMAAKLGADD